MNYLLSFLEGMITFISPCLLPMLPVYVSYFACQHGENRKFRTVVNALSFVLGFTLVFVMLGAVAGQLGSLLNRYSTALNLASGIIVIIFGLSFLDLIQLPLFNRIRQPRFILKQAGLLPSFIFGVIFSLSWTPCVGAFLGSALLLAVSGGAGLRGKLMLLSFSLGLGLPFLLSAVLLEQLMDSFGFIKRNYRIINFISGALLIAVGILMATGWLGRLLY